MAQIIDGKAISAKVKEEVRAEVERDGLEVGLAVVRKGTPIKRPLQRINNFNHLS